MSKEYTRECPQCHKPIVYDTKYARKICWGQNKVNSLCLSCSNKRKPVTEKMRQTLLRYAIGNKNTLGMKHSDETIRKVSQGVKQAWADPNKRKNMIENSKWTNVKVDKGQLELIGWLNDKGFNFQPNYQLKTSNNIYYLDGYDSIHNIVIEYDGYYHTKPNQMKKDLIRQNKIINILKPNKFWRYDAVNKQCKNVLEKEK